MNTVQKVIDLALNEVGYLEKKDSSNLDSKTGNAGQNNYTKYARDLDSVKFFNSSKNGYAWCSVFVHWLLFKCFDRDKALAMCYEPKTENYGAGVNYLWNYFKSKNATSKTPQVGDFIIFKSATYNYAHVGLVIGFDSDKVYTVEGNTSGASGVIANGGGVCKKSYALNYKYIVGYCRPNWYLVGGYDYEATAPKETRSYVSVDLPVLKKGCAGDDVKTLQKILIAFGYSVGNYGADGDYGTNTFNAVKKFQKENNITSDGVFGQNSWKALLRVNK